MTETMNKEMLDTNLRVPSSHASTSASTNHIKVYGFERSTVFRSSFQSDLPRYLIMSQVGPESTNDFPDQNKFVHGLRHDLYYTKQSTT